VPQNQPGPSQDYDIPALGRCQELEFRRTGTLQYLLVERQIGRQALELSFLLL
jgi:hypothetical protein